MSIIAKTFLLIGQVTNLPSQLFLDQLRQDEDGVKLSLLYWWYLHIVAIEVGEIRIRIARRREFLALKLDGTQRLYCLLVK